MPCASMKRAYSLAGHPFGERLTRFRLVAKAFGARPPDADIIVIAIIAASAVIAVRRPLPCRTLSSSDSATAIVGRSREGRGGKGGGRRGRSRVDANT